MPTFEISFSAAANEGMKVAEVFRVVPKNPSELGRRPGDDVRLTRFAYSSKELIHDFEKDGPIT